MLSSIPLADATAAPLHAAAADDLASEDAVAARSATAVFDQWTLELLSRILLMVSDGFWQEEKKSQPH